MLSGPLLFARYAFMPNLLGYCGGDDNLALLQYGASGTEDGGLIDLERQFEGAFPYLQLIASSAGIADPLDRRVVEAYWIGNELLDRVEVGSMFDSLTERFKSKSHAKDWPWLASKAPGGARPHHSFHVMEIYPRVGTMREGAVKHVVETMEQCRIRWGKVRDVMGSELLVEVQPLRLTDGALHLDEPHVETVRRSVDGLGFVDSAEVGQWVSIHWGWACDSLTERQKSNLERQTRWHIRLCNETL